MTKHTPGPWTARQRTGTPHEYTVSGRRDGKGETVCVVKDGPVARKVSNLKRLMACVNACEGINPEAVPDLLEAAKAAVEYDKAIRACADDPDKMSSYCTADGDHLDILYSRWMTASRAAVAKAEDRK